MTRTEFLTAFPEFRSADNELIDAHLSRAALSIGEAFGTHADEAHGLLTAHMLALSPFGQNARLVSDKGESTYGTQYRTLSEQCASGIRVFPVGYYPWP